MEMCPKSIRHSHENLARWALGERMDWKQRANSWLPKIENDQEEVVKAV